MKITNQYPYSEIKRTKGRSGRHYDVGGTRPLPSVTTVLSSMADKTPILEWRQRVGEQEANRITKEATSIGNQLHKNLEDYILEGKAPQGNVLTKILTDLVIKKGLSKVDEIWGVEVGLYNPELYAGTTDLVGVWQGRPAIMDFKNARNQRKREWIEDYFFQTVAYGEAHNELFGTDIRTGVIMMAVRDGTYQEFVIQDQEYDHYKSKWFDTLYRYYEKFGI